MEFLYFFGDRVEVLENGVGGGSEEVKESAPALPSAILAGTGGSIDRCVWDTV